MCRSCLRCGQAEESIRCSRNESAAPCLTLFKAHGALYFLNEAANGLIERSPVVDKTLPLSVFWVRCPLLGRWPATLVALLKTSLWLPLALVSLGQHAASGAESVVLIILDGLCNPVLPRSFVSIA